MEADLVPALSIISLGFWPWDMAWSLDMLSALKKMCVLWQDFFRSLNIKLRI